MKQLTLVAFIALITFASCRKDDVSCKRPEPCKKIMVRLSVTVGKGYHLPTNSYYWSYIAKADTVLPIDVKIGITWKIMWRPCVLCTDPYQYFGDGYYGILYKANTTSMVQKGLTTTVIPFAEEMLYASADAMIVAASCSDPRYQFIY